MNRNKKMKALLPHEVSVEKLGMAGGKYIGDPTLLTLPWPRIGVFASRTTDHAIDFLREQWGMSKGRRHSVIVGTFHSQAECELLYFVLKFGGSAVWFMGCSLPEKLPDFCKGAIRKGHLLIISCFNQEHHTLATARYCTQMVDMHSSSLAIWSMKAGGLIHPIYNRAKACGKKVEVF